MSPFDDLPQRDRNPALEDEAEAAFQALVTKSDDVVLQGSDRKDYGTDQQLEVLLDGHATNVRLHVQIKGTERTLNADGSLSIVVERANLNYLMAQPYSFYVAYHAPTKSLRISSVDAALRHYEHSGKNWTAQQTLTITLVEELTLDRLARLADLARSAARIARDRRIAQTTAALENIPGLLRAGRPELHLPEDPKLAAQWAQELYESGGDLVLSAAFEQFRAVFGAKHDAMGFC